jgi:Domain of unknown function (DUF3576)
MPAAYYRLPIALAASVSLALAGCSSKPPAAPAGAKSSPGKVAAAGSDDPLETDETIWTLLGIAKKPPRLGSGPQLGDTVNPTLWQAAHQALDFVRVAAEDPRTGTMITDWYSPPGKPDERLKVDVFILSRALRLSSLSVRVLRETRAAGGEWVTATVDAKAHLDLEAAILNRARQIRHDEVVKMLQG